MACFEQDLLNYLIQGNFFELKEIFCHTQNEKCIEDIFKKSTFISVFHYASPYLKPGNKLKHESILFEKRFINRAKNILKGQFKKYEVDVDKYIWNNGDLFWIIFSTIQNDYLMSIYHSMFMWITIAI